MKNVSRNILFYLPGFGAGGAERQALNLAIELKNNYGCNVTIAAQYPGGPIEGECNKAGINTLVIPLEFYYFKFKKMNPLSVSETKAHFVYRAMKRNFLKEINRVKPDCILSYCYEPNVIASYFKNSNSNCKVIWNQRDTGVPPLQRTEIEQIAVKNADSIVGNSKAAINYVSMHYPGILKCHIIPNGVNMPVPKNGINRGDLGLNDNDIVVGMVANYASKKNHLTLVHAYAQLVDINIKLLLIGRFSEKDKEILTEAAKNKLIRFHYEEQSMADVIGLCDLIVHSSISEGMPNAILEAMACRRLVLASCIEPHKEVLSENYPYLFDPENAEGLAALIKKAVATDNTLLIEHNSDLIKDKYSVNKLGEAYFKLINEQ